MDIPDIQETELMTMDVGKTPTFMAMPDLQETELMTMDDFQEAKPMTVDLRKIPKPALTPSEKIGIEHQIKALKALKNSALIRSGNTGSTDEENERYFKYIMGKDIQIKNLEAKLGSKNFGSKRRSRKLNKRRRSRK